MRRLLPWLVAFPLAVAGSLSAHEIAFWLVGPRGAETGARHAYLAHAPLALSALSVLLLAALAARAVSSARGREGTGTSAWWFFAVPPAGFVLQEHVEQLAAAGGFPFGTVLEPTFAVGFALQLPFALAALGLARLCLGAAARLGRRLAARASVPPRMRPAGPELPRPYDVVLPRVASLALGHAERGPPLLLG
jgi:hypothetical protein